MSRLERVVVQLPAKQMDSEIKFFESLGFSKIFEVRDPELYVGIRNGNVEIHLFQVTEHTGSEWMCRIQVSDIEDLYSLCEELKIVHPAGSLSKKPWGTIEFAVASPSNNLLTFFEYVK